MNIKLKSNLTRIGVISSNLSIACYIYTITALLSALLIAILPIFLFFLWVIVIVFTLGLIFLNPDFISFSDSILSGVEQQGNIVTALYNSIPEALVIGVILTILSIILFCFEPTGRKRPARLAVTITLSVFAILILLILKYGGQS